MIIHMKSDNMIDAVRDMIKQLDNSSDTIGAFLEKFGGLKLTAVPEIRSADLSVYEIKYPGDKLLCVIQTIPSGYTIFAGKSSIIVKRDEKSTKTITKIITALAIDENDKKERRAEIRSETHLLQNPAVQKAFAQFSQMKLSLFLETNNKFKEKLVIAMTKAKNQHYGNIPFSMMHFHDRNIIIVAHCEKLEPEVEQFRLLDYYVKEPMDMLMISEDLNDLLFRPNPLDKLLKSGLA